MSVWRGFCCSWLIWNLLLSQSLVLAFKPVGRILSRPCNDWPSGSLNESIFTAIGEDFCHGLRMSFWSFGFHATVHKINQAHLALFDCLLIPNRPSFRHRCDIKRQCRPSIYYANSVSTFQLLLVGDPGGDSHMKQTGMLVVSLRGVNFGFWSRLGCSGQSTNILCHQGLI